jgi:DnaK suppressor protein
MESYNNSMAPRFTQLLAQREAELRATLRATGDTAGQALDAEPREVTDFKDVAEEESLAMVDEAKAEHAAQELEQVLAARQRLLDGSYGDCLNCGEAIDLRRLTALPATPFCTACQAAHEREHKAPTHR